MSQKNVAPEQGREQDPQEKQEKEVLPGTGERPKPDFFEVIIIGSGFGGAVTACRLAQVFEQLKRVGAREDGAERICLLERGRRYEGQDFPRVKLPDYLTDDPDLKTSRRVPDFSRLMWGIDLGLIDYRNLGELQVVQGAGYGGGSLVYANVHMRPPAEMLETWPVGYRRAELEPYYDRVAEWMEVSPLPSDEAERIPKARLMEKIAVALDRRAPGELFRPPLAVRWKQQGSGENRYGKHQGSCTGCGNCTLGCQEAAKNTLDLNYLAVAEELGMEVRTLCEVSTLRRKANTYEIEYFDHLLERYIQVNATRVFLAAGAVGTTEILLHSLSADDPLTPAQDPERPDGALAGLGKSFYANGDSLGVVFDTKEPAEPGNGPTITTTVVHNQGHGKGWLQIQDGGIPPGLEALLGFFRSAFWMGRNRLTTARAGTLSTWRPSAEQDEAATDVAQISGVFAAMLATSSRLADGGLRTGLPREWVGFLPEPLRQLSQQLCDLSDSARTEAFRLNSHVMRKLAFDTGFATRLVDPRKLVDTVADSVADVFPLFANLLRQGRGLDVAMALGRFFLLGPKPSPNTMILLGMGQDDMGSLQMKDGRVQVTWPSDRANVALYGLQERMMRDLAVKLGGELRVNPNWTLSRRPITVHAQGGCGMGVVTDTTGQVFGLPNLYVMDAAGFPGSVGVNPASTVAAVAEKKIEEVIKKEYPKANAKLALEILSRKAPPAAAGAAPAAAKAAPATKAAPAVNVQPPLQRLPHHRPIRSAPVKLIWTEHMEGWFDRIRSDRFEKFANPVILEKQVHNFHPSRFEEQERRSSPTRIRFDLDLQVTVVDLDDLVRKVRIKNGKAENFTANLAGHLKSGNAMAPVSGTLTMKYVARPNDAPLLEGLDYDLVSLSDEHRFHLVGRKFFHDDPGHDVWPDLTTLYFVDKLNERAGIMRVPLRSFLQLQLPSFDAEPKAKIDDPFEQREFRADSAVKLWAILRFGNVFFGGIKDVYERWF